MAMPMLQSLYHAATCVEFQQLLIQFKSIWSVQCAPYAAYFTCMWETINLPDV